MDPFEFKIVLDTRPMVPKIEHLVRKEILDANFHCQMTAVDADMLFELLKGADEFAQLVMDTIQSNPTNIEAAVIDLDERTGGMYSGTLHPALRKQIILSVKQEVLHQFTEYLGYVIPPAFYID
jgi:hypothetical protein